MRDAQHDMAMTSDRYTVRVLLVDDQAMIGEAVRRALLRQPAIEFHYCNHPARAVELAESIRPTIILQDLVMPDIDGLSLVRCYRANPLIQDIPIVMLSTKEDPAVKSEAFALGANDYLIKLPDAIELIARILHHSKAYLNQLQRDAAYRALHESQQQLHEINAELQRLTHVDGLTGLSNRRYFNEYVDTQWKLAIREQTPFSILMIDVDNFKRYNDTYGHLAGDEVLRHVAGAVQNSFVRPTDLAARFGGEEFAVILPATAAAPLAVLGNELRRSVEKLCIPHSGSTVSEYVTVSVGGATAIPQPVDSYLQLIQVADKALYEAKETGKNKVVTRNQA